MPKHHTADRLYSGPTDPRRLGDQHQITADCLREIRYPWLSDLIMIASHEAQAIHYWAQAERKPK